MLFMRMFCQPRRVGSGLFKRLYCILGQTRQNNIPIFIPSLAFRKTFLYLLVIPSNFGGAMRLRASIFLTLLLYGSLIGGRSLRTVNTSPLPDWGNQRSAAAPETAAVNPVRIDILEDQVFLSWDEPRRRLSPNGLDLTGYIIYSGDTPGLLQPESFVESRSYSQPLSSHTLYSVSALYAGKSAPSRNLRNSNRDGRVLLDFEEGEFNFIPYDEQQDVDGDSCSITEAEAMNPSRRSLRLYGNTWKRLEFERQIVTDSTIWQISVMSVDGDTSGELHAFGVADGSHELIYTFFGQETVWDENWMIVNQEARPRGRWETFKLRLGYDWKIRFGYLPSIDQLIFINDNDTISPPSNVYFDQLTDITADISAVPSPKARWRIDRTVEGQGTAVRFFATVDNLPANDVTFAWDFGDRRSVIGFNPTHFFAHDGRYRVGLSATAPDGKIGRTSLLVEIGESRLPVIANLAFTGDVMLARRYEDPGGIIEQFGPEAVFSRIRTRTRSADLLMANLECPLTDEGTPHPMKDYAFRGRPANIAGLTSAGIDVVSLANNHVSDFGRRGLEETAELLDAAGILCTGAGMNEDEALQPAFSTVNGIRFGFLGYCNRTGRDDNYRPYLDAGYDKDGYAYFSADNILRSVPEVDGLCDFLVLSVHGGTEYAVTPSAVGDPLPGHDEESPIYPAEIDSSTRQLMHMAIDLGADLVICHHPHVLQGFEVYNGVPIATSLGNFAFDQTLWETWPSALVWVKFSRERLVAYEIEPIFVDSYYPTPAIGSLGTAILNRLAGYSTSLNATVFTDFSRNRAVLALDPGSVVRRNEERIGEAPTRTIQGSGYQRTPPIKLENGGYLSRLISALPEVQDGGWQIRWGKEILLVGGMEAEGASIWNYNSAFEGRDSSNVHSGRYSSYLRRNQGQQDAITDLIQRIPARPGDPLTLSGWIRITNGRDAAITTRYYRFRYDDQQQNRMGDQVVERRLQGMQDWTYLWQDLTVPAGTNFMNVRWQLFGALQGGGNQLWADDLALVRWESWTPFDEAVSVDYPNDFSYIQIQTQRPVDLARVSYVLTTLSLE
jgi:poly-gamma-glutamate synthesis protein (capsule biosynthesis protein)